MRQSIAFVALGSIAGTLAGRTIAEAKIRNQTGCSVIAIVSNGQPIINPDPHAPLEVEGELILIGQTEAERQFLNLYGTKG